MFHGRLSMAKVDTDSLGNQYLNFDAAMMTFCCRFPPSHPAPTLPRQSVALDCSIRKARMMNDEVSPGRL